MASPELAKTGFNIFGALGFGDDKPRTPRTFYNFLSTDDEAAAPPSLLLGGLSRPRLVVAAQIVRKPKELPRLTKNLKLVATAKPRLSLSLVT